MAVQMWPSTTQSSITNITLLLLSMISSSSVDKCSFKLLIVSKALTLPVLKVGFSPSKNLMKAFLKLQKVIFVSF